LFASAISRLSTYFWYEPRILFRKHFGVFVRNYYIPLLKNLLIVVVSVLLLGYVMQFFTVTGWISFACEALVVALVSALITGFCYRRSEGFTMLLTRVRGLFEK
jgi:hypothetical protein